MVGLPSRTDWLVPTVVQLELAKWLKRVAGQNEANRAIAFSGRCVVTELDTQLALTAAATSANCKLATADAIIYATATGQGAIC